eukprot:COSAG01_NODE_27923_length_673_cov_2.045296_1_plen_45_part_01
MGFGGGALGEPSTAAPRAINNTAGYEYLSQLDLDRTPLRVPALLL